MGESISLQQAGPAADHRLTNQATSSSGLSTHSVCVMIIMHMSTTFRHAIHRDYLAPSASRLEEACTDVEESLLSTSIGVRTWKLASVLANTTRPQPQAKQYGGCVLLRTQLALLYQ